MTAATRFRLFTLLLFTAPLPAAQAYTDTGGLPKVLQGEASGSTWATVVADATAQSTPATPPGSPNPANGGTPIYHSTQLEETTLEGDFTADADTTTLALFSDDGCDVSIGPDKDHLTKIWAARDQAQALPNLAASLYMLPTTLTPGQTYHIKIDYSNVIYTGNGDIDGVTLFAFKDTPPSVSMTADDPGDPNINQQVTGKVHASVDHLPSGHFAPDLTATWTWPVVGVTHSDTVDGTFTTDGVDATPFSVTSDNSDLISPTGTFTGTFALGGFYEVEVQANVKYHDNRTGKT